ncbi:MAG: hypothetical protein AB1489_35675 [Acidobacteriota bacterium]
MSQNIKTDHSGIDQQITSQLIQAAIDKLEQTDSNNADINALGLVVWRKCLQAANEKINNLSSFDNKIPVDLKFVVSINNDDLDREYQLSTTTDEPSNICIPILGSNVCIGEGEGEGEG